MLKYILHKGDEEKDSRWDSYREVAVGASHRGNRAFVVSEPKGRKHLQVEPFRDCCVNVIGIIRFQEWWIFPQFEWYRGCYSARLKVINFGAIFFAR